MKIFLALLLVSLLLALGFYSWHQNHSDALADAQGLSREAANGLKHSNAAAGIYQGLRMVKLSPSTAEWAVLSLGYINERLEQLVRFHKRDSTLEMMKDLHNNYVGIIAAQWLEKHSGQREATLSELANRKVLYVNRNAVSLRPELKIKALKTHDFQQAAAWFVQEKDKITAKVNKDLAKAQKRQ